MNMFTDPMEASSGCAEASQRTLIRLALEKTQQMLLEAECDRWENIQSLENERKVILNRCFEHKIAHRNSEIFAEALATMLHMNEELVALLEAAKEDASVRRTDHQFAHEAIGHYLDTKSESL